MHGTTHVLITGTRCALLLFVATSACGAVTRRPAAPEPPRIEVATRSCPPPGEARARLAGVLAAHRVTPAGLVVRVEAASAADPNRLRLRVTDASGALGLDRIYALGANDCASAAEVLAVGVDRFLASFPGWGGTPTPPRPPERWLDLSIAAGVSAVWRPAGVEGQVGAIVERGTRRHRLGGGVLVRATVPQSAGSGRFQQTTLLGAIRYRHRAGRWQVDAGARAGALVASGLGFAENRSDVLPWWEGVVAAGRVWSWGTIGVELAGTGLRHRAVTGDGLVAEDIPLVRLGLAVEIGLVSTKP